MRGLTAMFVLTALMNLLGRSQAAEQPPPNPRIDADAYPKLATDALALRAKHRLTEDEFLRMSREPNTVVLDARSADKFALLHIKGAINLPFPDVTVASLAQVLPDKRTRVLIYCNNNFVNDERAFPSKAVGASLNVPTFIMLYTYGYENVYELAPLLDVRTTKLPLVPTKR